MRKQAIAVLVLVALAVPATCLATPPRLGPYLTAFIGVNAASNTDVHSRSLNIDDEIQFDPGLNVGAAGGYDFGILRLEGEIAYKHSEVARVLDRLSGVRYTDIDGSVGVTSVMGNMYLDLHNPTQITPYLGGGAGFAVIHQEDVIGSNFSVFPPQRTELYRSDDDTVFCYQAGAGMEIELNPRLSLDLSYHYFKTLRASFNNSFFENHFRFESHNAAVGVRIKY